MRRAARPRVLTSWLVIAGLWACADPASDDAAETGNPGVAGTATLLGTLDPNGFCDMPQVVTIQATATRIGCAPGPPAPCTLPAEPETIEGDVRSCPVTDPEIVLGVDLTSPGRYHFEAVGAQTAGGQTRRCFAVDGNVEIEVTGADLDAAAQIFATLDDDPCPAPR